MHGDARGCSVGECSGYLVELFHGARQARHGNFWRDIVERIVARGKSSEENLGYLVELSRCDTSRAHNHQFIQALLGDTKPYDLCPSEYSINILFWNLALWVF